MKFKCGLTREEMDARDQRDAARLEARKKWHPFYAILPREVSPGECVAFAWIERRRVDRNVRMLGDPFWEWEYRA
jgi:hypothetical protein